jgi:putative copper export protein
MGGPLQVGAKAALFAGIVLFLGAGVFARWIAPPRGDGSLGRRLRAGFWVGALLVAGGSVFGVLDTVSRALGTVDPTVLLSYMTDTRDGNAVIARFVVLLLILWLGTGRRRLAGIERAAFLTLGLALLATISLVSHAGAQPGILPVPADLGHLVGVTGWGGGLVYGAWLLPWRADERAVVGGVAARLSAVGLWSVSLIAATGVIQSLVHLWGPRALTETDYGRVLLIKLAVVCGVVAIAAINRWVALPSLVRGAPPARLGGLVKAESLLFLAVIGVTSFLVAQAPPGPPPTLSRPVTFQSAVGPWTVRGTLDRRDPGQFATEMTFLNAAGGAVPAGTVVELTLSMLDMQMAPVEAKLTEVRPGTYQGRFFLPMTGRWQMAILAGGNTGRVTVQTEDSVFIQPLSPWKVVLPGVGVVLLGLAAVVVGLRGIGAGAAGSWRAAVAGVGVVIIGVALAARAIH